MRTRLLNIEWLYPRSLQQRTIIFLLVPIFLFLSVAGFFGYRAVRNLLLDQWGKTALANLERAAHQIDMQLHRPKQILLLLEGLSSKDSAAGVDEFILQQLRTIEGVISVQVDWPKEMADQNIRFMRRGMAAYGQHYRNSKRMFDITTPEYNVEHDGKTISMVTNLLDNENRKVGRIEVILDFETLIAQTRQTSWWKGYKAYIVDQNGTVLVSTTKEGKNSGKGNTAFGSTGALEHQTMEMLKDNVSGTVFGPGRPPEEISGFYRLKEAPWTMIVITPGKKVLKPIIHFRDAYFLTSFVCIALLLLFVRIMVTRTTKSIKKVSQTASDLARGVFHEPLTISTRDEVGELVKNFNTMTSQLQKGVQLQEAMAIASEVQATLLPQHNYSESGLEISGLSVYCDETGGDYFDFIPSDTHPGQVHVVVGDVVGHGIGAALLMATLRALVRANIDHPGTPDVLISKVNRQLCRDTSELGNFASLFFLRIDRKAQELQWIRAGHDPAILYLPASGKCIQLKGKGLVLGLNGEYPYQTNTLSLGREKIVLLISSDGVWEAENEQQEQFGQERLKELVKDNAHLAPEKLLHCITDAVDTFRGKVPLADDITLVAIAVDGSVPFPQQSEGE